jgi:hypothetical protein
MSTLAMETRPRCGTLSAGQQPQAQVQTLELSAMRAYDCALEALGAYKLTGNFVVELEVVLKELRVLDQVGYRIKPKRLFSDCRQVEFYAKAGVTEAAFRNAIRRVQGAIGSDPPAPLWTRMFP